MIQGRLLPLLWLGIVIGLAGCGQGTAPAAPAENRPPVPPTMESAFQLSEGPALEELDYGSYNQLLGRDAIPPVYDPVFVPAHQATLADEELVLGIAINGEAKAYPISVLNFREMVNDEIAGIPILATW